MIRKPLVFATRRIRTVDCFRVHPLSVFILVLVSLHLGMVPSPMVSAFSTAARRYLLNGNIQNNYNKRVAPYFFRTKNRNNVGRYSGIPSRLLENVGSSNSNSNSGILSNQQLVQQRLAVQRGKREARQRTIQSRVDKNYRLKRLIHTETEVANAVKVSSDTDGSNTSSEDFIAPPMYAVKVWVEQDFRQELKLSGREKRGRVFLEAGSSGVSTIRGLRQELHGFFAALRKNTYLVRASLPLLAEDGTLRSPSDEEEHDQEQPMLDSWPIETDEDVMKTFQAADAFFQESTTVLKRPSIQISILKDPNAPPPPPPPSYLEGMSDPNESPTMTMLSFYAFPPNGIADPEAFGMDLSKKWKPFQALGRVYVAQEGINAQMSVPTNVLENFMACCRSVPELEYMENGINIDPKPLSTMDFATAGVPVNGKPAPPFRNLHIRVRNQVLADGLWKEEDGESLSSVTSLDWQSAGYDMPPMEWHQKLKEAKDARERAAAATTMEAKDSSDNDTPRDLPIILDCRNKYESDVGIFEGAEPLDTDSFRDSWPVLKERLADAPKDTPIMTYCTGGIRCVKVGAYLTQELGFTNVSRLAGGIIAYDRTVSEEAKDEEPMFKGTNFVFDGRLGRQITEDALGVCATCGTETSSVSNCRNDYCHKRMIQCEQCKTSFHGTCSNACKNRLVTGGRMVPRNDPCSSVEETSVTTKMKFNSIEDYCVSHSSAVPSFYHEIELNTRSYLPSGSHMVSGAEQGRLLTQLASMTREGRILELGTFTGYATACFVEGAANAGRAIGATHGNAGGGPYVMTMERDARALNLASAHLSILAQHGLGGDESGGEAMRALRDNENGMPEMDQDVISLSLFDGIVGCDIVRVTDALAIVEEIATGGGNGRSDQPAPFDLVFVDADKTRLLAYVETCLSNDNVLKRGGYIVVDNVLWKGLVLEASSGEFTSVSDDENLDPNNPNNDARVDKEELRKNRRARKLASQMHAFNHAIVKDDRVEVLVLPMRDGLSVLRKR